MSRGKATVLQSGPSARPSDLKPMVKVFTDRDGHDNAFWLTAGSPYPSPGTEVAWNGRIVTWAQDGVTQRVRHQGWYDDRGQWMGVARQMV